MWTITIILLLVVPIYSLNCTDIHHRPDCITDCDCHWCSNSPDHTDLSGFCTDHDDPCEYFNDVNDNYHCARYWALFVTLLVILPVFLLSVGIYIILQYRCIVQNCYHSRPTPRPSRIDYTTIP